MQNILERTTRGHTPFFIEGAHALHLSWLFPAQKLLTVTKISRRLVGVHP